MHQLRTYLLTGLASLCLLLTSCQNSEPKQTNTTNPKADETNITTTPAPEPATPAAPIGERITQDQSLYAWVDNLNVRDQPSLKGKTIATVQPTDALTFTGKKSKEQIEIVLRGVLYEDAWLQIKTPEGKTGWVFGGAVKLADEQKGNALIGDTEFAFDHFGTFDLSTWTMIDKPDGFSTGDVEGTITTYKKGDQTLEITAAEVGEYGYNYTYKLWGPKRKLRKIRTFAFDALADPRELSETVEDYTTAQPTKYSRLQKIKTHFYSLNARPLVANAPWQKAKADPPKPTDDGFVFGVIEDFNSLPKGVVESDCGCDFNISMDKKQTIMLSTYEDAPLAKAIIRIGDEYLVLNSRKPENRDFKRGDVFKSFYNDTYAVDLTLTEEGADDGGGPQYTGTIKLSYSEGETIVELNVFGGCGC